MGQEMQTSAGGMVGGWAVTVRRPDFVASARFRPFSRRHRARASKMGPSAKHAAPPSATTYVRNSVAFCPGGGGIVQWSWSTEIAVKTISVRGSQAQCLVVLDGVPRRRETVVIAKRDQAAAKPWRSGRRTMGFFIFSAAKVSASAMLWGWRFGQKNGAIRSDSRG